MKIKTINKQYGRAFYADYECENCGYIERDKYGYDVEYFHKYVIPRMVCPKCGESTISLGSDFRPLTPKHPEGFQI